MVGIAIAAVGIRPEIIYRCYRALSDAKIGIPYRVHIQTTCEGGFSRSAARNQAILALMPYCDKIICIDVDCLVPPGLIEHAAKNIWDGRAVWALARKIADFDGQYHWEDWKNIELWFNSTGTFIGMTTADWLLIGGWDERIITWGGEDDVLVLRRREHNIKTFKITEWPLVHVNHEYRGRNFRHARENRQIGSTPPPKNYLSGRLPIDTRSHKLYIWVNGPHQSFSDMSHLPPQIQDYQMNLDEVEGCIEAIRSSGYSPFHQIIITGKQPLLWNNLVPCLQALHTAQLGALEVHINDIDTTKIRKIIDFIDCLQISYHGQLQEQAVELCQQYAPKVRIVKRHKQPRLHGPYGNELLPADCACPGYLLYNGYFYPCYNIPSIAFEVNRPLEQVPRCRVQPGFIELLTLSRRSLGPFCRTCPDNRKLYPFLEQTF